MTDTRRATTGRRDGAAIPSNLRSSQPEYLITHNIRPPSRQDAAKTHLSVQSSMERKTHSHRNGRMTFNEALASVRPANICRLKNHAFAANEVAKMTTGKSRMISYRIKDRAINTLLGHCVALLCTLELSVWESVIGIAFAGGGKLHTKPSSLDSRARNIQQQQLIAAINDKHDGTTSTEAV
jgi:hypothetical protein